MMKLAFSFLLAALATGVAPLHAEAPRGDLVELHSCEVYTGGCTASAEATLEGRWMLRAWTFESGEFAGSDLSGLSVALLESADENLAEMDTPSDRAVIYVPNSAGESQRNALTGWARSQAAHAEVVAVKPVAMTVTRDGSAVGLSAGDSVRLETRALQHCDTGGCGESLWYTPRSQTSAFHVVMNAGSAVTEPFLAMKWRSNGKRSVFVGRFEADAKATDGALAGPMH